MSGALAAVVGRLQGARDPLLRLFVWFNLAFVGVDVYLAHLVNDFHHWGEWIPIGASAACALLLAPWLLRSRLGRWVDDLALPVLGSALLVGVLGFYYHLTSGHLMGVNLQRLVYSAPLLAPLAYAGIACVGLVALRERWLGMGRRQWLLVLTAGGFFGNGVLCVIDHARNGFYYAPEWVSAAAGLAGGFCLLFASTRRELERTERRALVWLLAFLALVGLAGAALHMGANLAVARERGLFEGFVFGAPAMAPLLFVDTAMLGLIALLYPGASGEEADAR